MSEPTREQAQAFEYAKSILQLPDATSSHDNLSTLAGQYIRAEQQLETLQKNLQVMLKSLAAEIRPCKACGEKLYFIPTRAGKWAPFNEKALNHFADCPKAARFKRKASA